jgi:hypothetical protein
MAYGFDVDRLLVWLAPRDPDGGDPMRAGSLCKRHADAMVVPRGWTLDDRRDTRPRLFRTAPAATEPAATEPARPARRPRTRKPPADGPPPSEQLELDPAADVAVEDDVVEVVEIVEVVGVVEDALDEAPTVAEVTGAPLADDDPDATVAIPWLPTFDDGDDLDGMLAARSPLLARAFRGTDRPR